MATPSILCELCYPEAIELGWVAAGYMLILQNQKYKIVVDGCRDPNPFVFADKPTPDPDPNNEHEEDNDPVLTEAIAWLEKADDASESWLVPVEQGYYFMDACIKSGNWNEEQHPIFHQWLYHHVGKLIYSWEQNNLGTNNLEVKEV